MRTCERADRVAACAQLRKQMCTDESARARYGDAEGLGQEPVPAEEIAAPAAASSDAAYIRRADEREGLPEDVRGNAWESTNSTSQLMPNSVLICACTVCRNFARAAGSSSRLWINRTTRSPASPSASENAIESPVRTVSWHSATYSRSCGQKFRPPTMIMSFSRPVTTI